MGFTPLEGVPMATRAGSLDTRDVTVSGNVAASGGGISLDGFTNATIEQSTISGNAAIGGGPITGDGGGIRSGGALVLRNSTVSINVASNLAGGLLNFKTAAIFSSTFAYNAAGGGNGLSIWNDEVTGVTAQNTIVTSVDPSRNCHGPVASLGHNIDSGNSCLFAAPGDLASTNPLLGALAPNGGATSTHALLPGSPAIDAGDDVLCPATDQRGVSRPQGPHCDIGSYERGALPFIHLEIPVFLHIVDPSKSGLCPGPAASCVISPNGAEIRFFPPQQGDPATIFEQGKPVAACVTQEGVCDVSLPPGRYLAVVKIAGIEQKPFYDAELISTDGQKPELHFKRLVKKNG